MKRFLVTGGAGFIGSHLVHHLLEKGFYVSILDNLSYGKKENLPFLDHFSSSNYSFIKGFIEDYDCCVEATKNIHGVFHLASLCSVPASIENPVLYEKINSQGTLNILQAAKKNKVNIVIQSSSSAVYGDNPKTPKKEGMTPHPKSPYAFSKLSNEYYGQLFTDVHNMPVISLRYFNVYGPRQNPNSQYAAVIPTFIHTLSTGKTPTIYGDGSQTRDFIFVDDIIQANIKSCFSNTNAHGKIYNIGSSLSISINDLMSEISTLIKTNINANYIKERAGDIKHSLADIELAKKLLNFTPNSTLKEGLTKTIKWFKNNHVT